MLTANETDYWALICNPKQFVHTARKGSAVDPWPDHLQWRPEDLKVPAELVWTLKLDDAAINQLLLACAVSMSSPALRCIIDRAKRDQVERVLGDDWFALAISEQVPVLPDELPNQVSTQEMLAGLIKPQCAATAYLESVFSAFGPAWAYSLRQRLAPELTDTPAEQEISRSTAFGRILWLHESVWPFVRTPDFQKLSANARHTPTPSYL